MSVPATILRLESYGVAISGQSCITASLVNSSFVVFQCNHMSQVVLQSSSVITCHMLSLFHGLSCFTLYCISRTVLFCFVLYVTDCLRSHVYCFGFIKQYKVLKLLSLIHVNCSCFIKLSRFFLITKSLYLFLSSYQAKSAIFFTLSSPKIKAKSESYNSLSQIRKSQSHSIFFLSSYQPFSHQTKIIN